jgi:hypothetical protein
MYPRSETVVVDTNASGDGSGYTIPIEGLIYQIAYHKAGTNGYENGVGFTITLEDSGQLVLAQSSNSSFVSRPRALVQKAADGTDTTSYEAVCSAGERVKIVVATAGSTAHTGTFVITYG